MRRERTEGSGVLQARVHEAACGSGHGNNMAETTDIGGSQDEVGCPMDANDPACQARQQECQGRWAELGAIIEGWS